MKELADQGSSRRMAAIVVVDVVGSSRLVEANETAALGSINTVLTKILKPSAERYGGRLVKLLGDGALLEFASPVLAVRCAVEVQETVEERARAQSESERVRLRIGINLGDIRITKDGDVLGDGVNAAARLESLADPGGICVSSKVYDELEGKLALPFADLGEQQLKGIDRRVRLYALRPGAGSARAPQAVWQPADHRGRPSIAVLPFANLSGDSEQEYFADGVADDIHTSLSKSRWLFVMSRSSAFVFKGKAMDVDEIARKLGVSYVLSGSVRRSPAKIRVSAQLIQADTGEALWAERYDRDLADLIDLQDEIAQSVAGAIEPQLIRSEAERGHHRKENLTAWDLVRRGMWHFHKFTPDDHVTASSLFSQAIEADRNSANGHIWLARTEGGRVAFLGTDDVENSLRIAYRAADRAVQLDPQNPYSHYAVSAACNAGCDFDRSVRAAKQAISLNPSFALGHLILGVATLHTGHPREAAQALERGLRLSPYDPQFITWLFNLAVAYRFVGEPEKGLAAARRALDLRPGWAAGLFALATNARACGLDTEARKAWSNISSAPDQTADTVRLLRRSQPDWVGLIEREFAPD
jgi:adenylate cyclase